MSLYHEAAAILDTVNKGKTSLKAEIFGKKTWKTDGKVLFALTSEAAKWSSILAEVVEKSGLLKIEKQVCIFLSAISSFFDSSVLWLTSHSQSCRQCWRSS